MDSAFLQSIRKAILSELGAWVITVQLVVIQFTEEKCTME